MISKLAVLQSWLALFALLSSSVLNADALRSGRRLSAEMQENRMMNMMSMKENYWSDNRKTLKDEPSRIGQPEACTTGSITINGVAYACNNVNFLGYVSRSDLKITRPGFNDPLQELSDIWGWTSPSGKEISLVCLTTGVRFVDTTDPTQPKILGYMAATRAESFWCDIKVYKDVAYVVKDSSSNPASQLTNGIQVFDLLRLEAVDGSADVAFTPDFVYPSHSTSHNVVVNTETGFLYTVGNKGDTCSGGLHMISLADPIRPVFAGCAGADGYVHDAQCVSYRGPDTRFTGKEICFGYNEDTLTIYDVTVKTAPVIISKKGYVGARYTHQGWLHQDMDYLLLDDELDEESGLIATTKTFVVDVRNLSNPIFTGSFDHGTPSIDHNLYMWGPIHRYGWGGSPPMENPPSDNYAYCANYCAGLRVLDISGMKQSPPVISTAGFFDVSPCSTTQDWYGAWSNYMHASGVIAVSSIDMGLFLLEFPEAFDSVATDSPVTAASGSPTKFPTPSPTKFPSPFPTNNPVTPAPVTAPVTPAPVFVVTDFPTVALTSAPVPSPVSVPTTPPVLPPSSVTAPTATNAPVPTTSGGADGGFEGSEGAFLGIVIGLFAAIIALVTAIVCVYINSLKAKAAVENEVKVKPILGSYGAPIGTPQKI